MNYDHPLPFAKLYAQPRKISVGMKPASIQETSMTPILWTTQSLVESLEEEKELDIQSCWYLKTVLMMKEVQNVHPSSLATASDH